MLTALPPRPAMLAAFLASDAAFDGLFLTGARCWPRSSATPPAAGASRTCASAA